MPTPFPGMDLYLERAGLWEEVHAGLIVAIQQELSAQLRPRFRVAIEHGAARAPLKPPATTAAEAPNPLHPTSIAVELPMPEDVVERYLEVRDATTGAVVTVIEILSPTNKLPGEGRLFYERKRLRVLASATHLIEIDLLRTGPPLPMRLAAGAASGYRVMISRAPQRPQAQVLRFGVRDPIPDVPIPLSGDQPEPLLPLGRILHELYDRAGYDMALDYQRPPEPPLAPADAAWARDLLSERGTS